MLMSPFHSAVGKHRHFRMIALQGKIRDMTGVALAFEEIWKKLEDYYSLEDLDELVRIYSDADPSGVDADLARWTTLAQTRHLHLHHTLLVLVLSRHCHDQQEDTAIIMDHCTLKMTWIRLVEDRTIVVLGSTRLVIDRAHRNLLVLPRNYPPERRTRVQAREGRKKEG